MTSYGPLCTEFYDLDKPYAPADAIEYYRQRALDANGPVLEPMCGSGRFLLPLLGSGIDIDGTDASPTMLQACARHAARRGLAAALYLQPVETLELPRLYRMAFVPSGSIGLLHPDAIQGALISLRSSLSRGSVLLLELVQFSQAEEYEREEEPRAVQVDEQTTLLYTCRKRMPADLQSIELEGRYDKRRNSRVIATETEYLRLWRHEPQEFLQLLGSSGFAEARVVNDEAAYASLAANGCILVEAHTEA